MSKIVWLSINNLRKIVNAEFDLGGQNFIQLRGKNQAGKTTVIDAVDILLGGGKIPKGIIKKGQKKATIVAKVDDYTIKRVIRESGSHELTVTKDGMKQIKPQAFIDKMAGKFIDPLRLSELSGKEKKKELMNYLGLDFKEQDAKIKDLMEQRKQTTRDLKSLGEMDEVEEAEEVSIKGILEKITAVNKFNKEQNAKQREIEDADRHLGKMIESRDDIVAQIAELQKDLQDAEQKVSEAMFIADDMEEPEELKLTDDLEDQLANAEEYNKKYRKYQDYLEYQAKAEKIGEKHVGLAEMIKEIREEKQDALKAVEMPIEGLTIEDDGLSFNGITDDNWSDSESIKICTYLGAALSSELKIMYIKRGESLDHDSLEELRAFVVEHDYQVIIEIVGECGAEEEEGVFSIREGNVAPAFAK